MQKVGSLHPRLGLQKRNARIPIRMPRHLMAYTASTCGLLLQSP
jgi:hypothetical protein